MKKQALIFTILFFVVLSVQAEEIGYGNVIYRARNLHQGNLIRVTFHNHGMMGSQKGDQSQYYAGEWPKGTGMEQMGNTSAYVMSSIRVFAGLDSVSGDSLYEYVTPAIFCEGWDPDLFSHDSLGTFYGFEPLPGYLNITQKEADPQRAVAMSHEPFTWPSFWPDKLDDANDPGWSGHWNGYFGKDQVNSDEESYFVMDDYQYKKRIRGFSLPKPVPSEPDRGGLGIRLSARGLQWANPDAEDCIFWLYEIRNFGELFLDQVLYGANVGASSGGLVNTANSDYADDGARYYRESALAVNYDLDNQGVGGYTPVPWVGFAYLESPGNPYDGIDNDGDGYNGTGVNMEQVMENGIFGDGIGDFSRVIQVGGPIILINYESGHFERTLSTMPENGITFTRNGTVYTILPNHPVRELPRNGVDDNLDGLIDESDGAEIGEDEPVSYYLYIYDSQYNQRYYKAIDYYNNIGVDNTMIDERRDDGIDNDNDWNSNYDDVGLDGKPATGDYGEGDGLPTPGQGDLPGEPNIDQVDVDESDQIGLTSFKFFQYGTVTYSNDDQMWELSYPGFFDLGTTETADWDYLFSSGYFPLTSKQEEFFSVAMLYGWDESDILNNKDIVQKIYNSNYNFAIAPVKPELRFVAGDKKVTLFWDTKAEDSWDRFLSENGLDPYDFEGYKIYRATHYTFEDAGSITDGLGYERYKQPIAIYDKVDDIYGYFQDTFGTGIQFNLGNETGLVHTFVDSPLVNGITYYYAVTAYDHGEPAINIGPTETTKYINVDQSGNFVTGENVVAVTPQAPSAGYVATSFDQTPELVGGGYTSGVVGVNIIEPDVLADGDEYEIQFLDISMDQVDNDHDGLVDMEDIDESLPIVTTGFVLNNISKSTLVDTIMFLNYREVGDSLVLARNLFDDGYDDDPRSAYALVGGMQIYVRLAPPGLVNDAENRIINGVQASESLGEVTGYNLQFSVYNEESYEPGTAFPRTYEIVFYDELVSTSDTAFLPVAGGTATKKLYPRDANFIVHDLRTGEELPFGFEDRSRSRDIVERGYFSASDQIVFFERFPNDSMLITYRLFNDVTSDTGFYNTYGRTIGAGDTIRLYPMNPLTGDSKYRFKLSGHKVDKKIARNNLNKIKVVPNPYAAAAVWEPRNPYSSGRGPRKIEFIHLPEKCTIRIYAVDGTLVRTLEHDSPINDGSESWDLMTKDNMDLAYGIYIYHVDAPGIGEHIGRMLIIK